MGLMLPVPVSASQRQSAVGEQAECFTSQLGNPVVGPIDSQRLVEVRHGLWVVPET